jgi:HK97 family phage major capsid protein
VPEEIAFKINDGIVNGTGAGMPQGFLGSGALVAVTKKAGQAADTVIWENVKSIKGRVPPRSFARGVWLVNQEIPEHLEAMVMNVGTGGVPVYMPANGISGAPYATMYGRPVISCEQCAAIGDQGDINFFDGGHYYIGWKGMVDQSISMHLEFDYARTCFRWILEMDGQPAINSAVTPYKGAKTLSPFVTVEAR